MNVTIDDRALREQLKNMPYKIRKAIEKKAMMELGKIAVKHLKRIVPVKTKTLKNAVGSKVIRHKRGGMSIIGIKSDYKVKIKNKTIQPSHYFHIVERGSKTQPAQNLLPQVEAQVMPQLQTVLNDL
ncbi:MAG: HK97 gp10 family phage protein [Planctomycetaceae bacterium]|jgi:HK97 gp10 family phage protein|nr:HK97 gp10 family phage protein [Planctomycetaceae bacterium]